MFWCQHHQVICLDLVLANDEGLITLINRSDNLEDYSDHFSIQIEKTGTSREPQLQQEKYYSHCNCDFDYLNELIANSAVTLTLLLQQHR